MCVFKGSKSLRGKSILVNEILQLNDIKMQNGLCLDSYVVLYRQCLTFPFAIML